MSPSQQTTNRFAVAVCVDSKMLPLACTTLYSAHRASPDMEFDKIILGLDLTPEDVQKIHDFAKQKIFSIKPILVERKNLGPVIKRYGAAALRLRMDKHVKEHYDRILYLDCDILVMESLYQLFLLDLQGNTAAAVADLMKPWKGNFERLKQLGVTFGNYFNSGVILFDMEKSNASMIWDQSESDLEKRHWRRPDQDVLNKALANKWFHLPIKWNFITPFHYQSSIRPAIVHFAGGGRGGRPWYPGSIGIHQKYRHIYEEMFSNTIWEGFIPNSTLWERIRGEYDYYLSTIRRHFPVQNHLKRNNFVLRDPRT